MNPVRTGAMLLLVGATATGWNQAPAGPTIVSTYLDGLELVFTPPDSIDWDALLPPELHLEALTQNRALRQQLFEHRTDERSSEVPFKAPPSPAQQSRFYYLIDSSGVREVRLAGLKGIARIQWRGESDSIESLRSFGYARIERSSNGGFVLISPGKLPLTVEPSALTADSLLAPGGGDYFGRGTPFRSMVRQYLIRAGGPAPDHWVFVQWLADTAGVEGFCTYRFSLFRFKPEPVEAATLDSACDV